MTAADGDFSRPRKAHLVGIAGWGMRALAEVLCDRGWQLSGSDLAVEAAAGLAARGVWLRPGHTAEHVDRDVELVVHSDAVAADNPELRCAAERGLHTLSYFAAVGQLTAGTHLVAFAGTHGKSTTTAMAAAIWRAAGRDPTVFCGAAPPGQTSGGRAGRDPVALVEACEYRANFLHLRPRQAVLLGIEPDHFDCFPTTADLDRAFAEFVARLPADGLLLARADCPAAQRAAASAACPVKTFALAAGQHPLPSPIGRGAGGEGSILPSPACGRGAGGEGVSQRNSTPIIHQPTTPIPTADWTAELLTVDHGRYRFTIRCRGAALCEVQLPIAGRHNALNALAAAAIAAENGIAARHVVAGLEAFAGLGRRLEVRGCWRGIALVDDYAHHPTAVRAALSAVREMFPGKRVWCVFQSHQASRTARLLDELAASLRAADGLAVAEIYRAREGPPQPGEITAADLARRVADVSNCHAMTCGNRPRPGVILPSHSMAAIVADLKDLLTAGDVLVTLGAGDIRRLSDELTDHFALSALNRTDTP